MISGLMMAGGAPELVVKDWAEDSFPLMWWSRERACLHCLRNPRLTSAGDRPR
jgi:hypothetical protein